MSQITDLLDQIPEFGPAADLRAFQDPAGNTITELCGMRDTGDGSFETFFKYSSAIQVITPQGPVNVQFTIPAVDRSEAVKRWRPAAQAAVKQFLLQVQESQRRVIVPGAGVPPGPFSRPS